MNEIPFAALDAGVPVWGSGTTSEGIDQNPALYDFLLGQPWRDGPVRSIAQYLADRAHRRYGLFAATDPDVTTAWETLEASMYRQDVSVADFTGVKNLPGGSNWDFTGRPGGPRSPASSLCETYRAWRSVLAAAKRVDKDKRTEPMIYDLIDLGRDVLARLTTPISQNFTMALGNGW